MSKLEKASHNAIILDVSIILLPSVGLPRAGQRMLNEEQTAAPPSELLTASPKVMKIFSHPQTRNQSQVV